MQRRDFLGVLATGAAFTLYSKVSAAGVFGIGDEKKGKEFPVTYSEAEWKEKLTPEEFRVLRKAGTEPAFSSELNDEKREGVFVCAGCQTPVYASDAKFDSGTGWPSFYQPVKTENVETSTDFKLIYPRTEVHCATCGGHLGHVFKDGPEPTGLRHCINGIAMDFVPTDEG